MSSPVEFYLDHQGERVKVRAQMIQGTVWLHVNGETITWQPSFHSSSSSSEGAENQLTAPMPGKVVKINATAGQSVNRGDVIIVMEAMKMEYTLAAPFDGTVAEIGCTQDEQVDLGQVLAIVEEN